MSDPYWPPQAQNPYTHAAQYQQPGPRTGNPLAVVSLVLGIVACLLLPVGTGFVLGGLLGIPALVCGIIGIVRTGQGANGRGLAIAGTALAGLAIVGAVLLVARAAGQGDALHECIAKASTPEEQISCSLTN